MRGLVLTARVVLGAVLLAAAGLKAMHPEGAAIAVGAFHLTPPWLSVLGGVLLPGVEAVAGAALVAGFFLRGAALVATGLSSVFVGGIASAMVRRLDLDCGCFGHLAIAPRAGWTTLGVDLFLLALSAFILWGSFRSRGAS